MIPKGYLFAAIAILVWGVTFANTRMLLEEFSALEINLIRFSVAWGVLRIVEFWTVKGNPSICSWRQELLFAAMGLSGVAVYQFLENCAIYYTNASNVAILVSFGPIVTAIMARLFRNDKTLSPTLIVGSVIAIVGVAMVALNGVVNFSLRPIGDLMALGAMMSWGVYSILIDKANDAAISPVAVIRKSFGWALLWMLPLALWGLTEEGFYAMDGSYSITLDLALNVERFSSLRNLTNFLFLGGLASALSFVFWNRACQLLGVVRTTIGLYLTPIVGVIFAMLFLGEMPTLLSLGGGGLIIAGVVIANLRRRKL